MKTVDSYTRFILTVIAGCLLWLCFRGADTLPRAYGDPAKDVQDVRIVAVQKPNGQPGQSWDPVNVWTTNR